MGVQFLLNIGSGPLLQFVVTPNQPQFLLRVLSVLLLLNLVKLFVLLL